MKKYGIYSIFLFFWCTIHPMQKQPSDLLVGAAAFGNLQGVENNLKNTGPDTPDKAGRIALIEAAKKGNLTIVQKLVDAGASISQPDKEGNTALAQAAKNGHFDVVKYLADTLIAQKKPNEISQKDNSGQTPLMWATLALDKTKTKDYENITNFLIKVEPRTLLIRDKDGLTPIHTAARSGNSTILDGIATNANKLFFTSYLINDQGAEKKGRTPLAEAVRASKHGIIHLDLENQTFQTPQEYFNALKAPQQGIAQFLYKEKNKLTTQQIVDEIKVLRKLHAIPSIPDASGHTLDYYINNVLVIPEAERIQLLQALGFSVTPRVIKAPSDNDIITAIKSLMELFKQTNIPQVQLAAWTISHARQTQDQTTKLILFKIAMGMIAAAKEKVADKTLENKFDEIRTMVRDAALVLQ